MVSGATSSVKEVALLTKGIEFFVRNLMRILVGKITLVRLQEMIEAHFIAKAETTSGRNGPAAMFP